MKILSKILRKIRGFLKWILIIFGVTALSLAIFSVYSIVKSKPKSLKDPYILRVEISQDGNIPEYRSALGILDKRHFTFIELLSSLEKARSDKNIKGVEIIFKGSGPSLSQSQELREIIFKLTNSQKPVWAYACGDLDTSGYLLASSCEKVFLAEHSALELTGIGIQVPFAKDLLEKVGIEVNVEKRKEFKSFADSFKENKITAPHKEETLSLLGSLKLQIERGISIGRNIDPSAIRSIIDDAPYTATASKEKNLIDGITFEEEFQKLLSEHVNNKEIDRISVEEYTNIQPQKSSKKPSQKRIAIIYAIGNISDDDTEEKLPLRESFEISPTPMMEAFEEAVEDDDVAAIVLRLDTPGGIVSASNIISHYVEIAKKEGKPVVISMGETAASGGYWIAACGDRIVANPSTITGSIGVVMIAPYFGPLMKNIGVNWEVFGSHKNSLMQSPFVKESPQIKEKHRELADHIYEQFVTHVSKNRNISMSYAEEVAKGRVWTGQQALENKLVDKLGGLYTAINEAKKLAHIDEDETVALVILPEPESIIDFIYKKLFGIPQGEYSLVKGAKILRFADMIKNSNGILLIEPSAVKF